MVKPRCGRDPWHWQGAGEEGRRAKVGAAHEAEQVPRANFRCGHFGVDESFLG